ncbi:MAG: capsular polysaccharide export protein, LipB/KpsS family, partial [Algiphilus sp.]
MRIQLFYNSPKARRYFRALREGLTRDTVALAPIGLSSARALPKAEVNWMTAYSVARKVARPHLSEARVRQHTQVLRRFARWHYAAVYQRMRAMRPDVVGVWGGQGVDTRAVRAAAAALGIPCVLFETGLLPSTTTADARGVNFENAVPRDPRFYARYTASAALPQQFVARRPPQGAAEPLPARYVFVPFQVALDSQVLLYSPWIRSMAQFYWLMESCLREVPEPLHLVCKPHPSCNETHSALRRHAATQARIRI